jgi:hypothetical protein
MKPYSKLVILTSLILAVSCGEETKVVTKKNVTPVAIKRVAVKKIVKPELFIPSVTLEVQKIYKKRIIEASKPKVEKFVGEAFFAGFKARKQGFKSAERVELENIKLGAFKCKYFDPTGIKTEAQLTDVWCHFYSNYYFKDSSETERVYKSLMKVRIDERGKPVFANDVTFKTLLEDAFVVKDPIANNSNFKKYIPNLKEGRLSVGMPEEFLRVCWGSPKHVVDFELNQAGRRETFVYRDYFVVLNNRIVTSVHRFNDVKPKDPTAGL